MLGNHKPLVIVEPMYTYFQNDPCNEKVTIIKFD